MRAALVTEREVDSSKHRCGVRRAPGKRLGAAEPDDAKGRADTAATRHGAITC